MALLPYPSDINKRIGLIVNDYKNQQTGIIPQSLEDGDVTNASSSMYWFNTSTQYIDVNFNQTVNIWRYPLESFPSYTGKLKILVWNGASFVDFPQTETALTSELKWTRIFTNIPKGRYKFIWESGTYRADAEWFIERVSSSKILLSSGDTYVSNLPLEKSETNLIPQMTSNTSPIGIAKGSSKLSTNYWEYYAFDGLIDKSSAFFYSWLSSTTTGWLEYQFSNAQVVNKYSLMQGSNLTTSAPKTWEFQGSNDGVNYVTLDKRENITDWVLWEKKYFLFSNEVQYKIYRINITANNGHAQYVGLQEMEMFYVNPKIRIVNGSLKEKNFIDHGSKVFNPTAIYKGTEDISQNSVALGLGKTFEHTIDMSKRRIDKIKLS